MIQVKNLTKNYGKVAALKGINFQLKKGEICGLLGLNGAGKSTTLKIISGFLKPDGGSVQLNGLDLFKHSLEIRRQIGYVPETPILYKEMTIRSYLAYVGRLKDIKASLLRDRIEQVVESCGLQTVLRKTLGTVSKGYRQRAALAQALLGDPPILLLDEPTSALDPLQIIEIRNLICSLAGSRTILLCTHILSEAASLCKRVMILNQGCIIADRDLLPGDSDLEKIFIQAVLT